MKNREIQLSIVFSRTMFFLRLIIQQSEDLLNGIFSLSFICITGASNIVKKLKYLSQQKLIKLESQMQI